MFHIPIRWLRSLCTRIGFTRIPVLFRSLDADRAPPGTVVRHACQGFEGILTGWLTRDGDPCARVVFIGQSRNWVDVVEAELLEVA